MHTSRNKARWVSVTLMGAALALAPYAWDASIGTSPAFAQGNSGGGGGGGGGGGNSGGNGNAGGNSGNAGNSANAGQKDSPGKSDRGVAASQGNSFSRGNANVGGTASAHGKAANELGNLNAAHASANARSNAAPGSMVGQIATYEAQMKSALAIQDPAQRAAAITAARQDLALSANKQLTPAAVTRVDSLIGLPASPSNLGTTTATRSSANVSTSTRDKAAVGASAQSTAHGKAASALGNLNAAHASANARANAAPDSMVGQIATYETQMKSALAIQDPAQRAAAITAARQDLALSANKQLTPAAITRVDSLLGLPASPAQLGTTTTTARR